MCMDKNIKILKEKKNSNKVLILGHHAQDYKSVLKYPFDFNTKRGFHPPAPTSLLYDNWQDFKGDIITCHYRNFNSKFVVTVEPSPRFHASDGCKVSNYPAYNKESEEAYNGMISIGLNPDDFNFINIPRIFQHKNITIHLYSGLFAILFSCMLGYKDIYTAGIDGTILGYKDGFMNKKKHIKALKHFVRKGYHNKVGIYENKPPKNILEWEQYKVTKNYTKRLDYIIEYCKEKYDFANIYKSHKLSMLPVTIKDPLKL